MYHDNTAGYGLHRMEIAPPKIQTLGEKPKNDYMTVALHPRIPSISGPSHITDSFVMEQMVFETVRFCTMKWIEDHVVEGMSMGQYHRIDTYTLIPQGMKIEGATRHEPGEDIYSYLNTTPLRRTTDGNLRRRIDVIEDTLGEMNKKPILDRQELEQMREQFRSSNYTEMNMPRGLKEHDFFENDNDFKME
jgi:hypothetical protein